MEIEGGNPEKMKVREGDLRILCIIFPNPLADNRDLHEWHGHKQHNEDKISEPRCVMLHTAGKQRERVCILNPTNLSVC